MWRRVVSGLLSLCLLLCLSEGAQAQAGAALPSIRSTPEYKALFKRMFDDPANVEVTFRFAEMATRLGDYEAAIGALERILYFNPNLPRVKLQLGALYFKLGAYKMARSYFDAAGAAGGADVQAEAKRFVAELEGRESPSKWSVFAQVGMRYQSNASQGPSGDIRSLGQSVPVSAGFASQPDWNAFGLFGVNYTHNVQQANVEAIEASTVGYYAKQTQLRQFDFAIIETTVGPRFTLPVQGWTAKVYGIGTTAWLGGVPYFQGGGAGVSTRMMFDNPAIAWVEAAFEYRGRNFFDSNDYLTASQQTGALATAFLRAQGTIVDRVQWFTRLTFEQGKVATEFDFNNYDRWAGEIGFPIAFDVDVGSGAREVVVTPFGGAAYSSFAQPNPSVDPSETRKDHEYRAGVMLDVQVASNVGFRAQGQYSATVSTLPNFRTQNYSVMFGPTIRF